MLTPGDTSKIDQRGKYKRAPAAASSRVGGFVLVGAVDL